MDDNGLYILTSWGFFLLLFFDVFIKIMILLDSQLGVGEWKNMPYTGEIKTQEQFAWRVILWIVPFSYLIFVFKQIFEYLKHITKLPSK